MSVKVLTEIHLLLESKNRTKFVDKAVNSLTGGKTPETLKMVPKNPGRYDNFTNAHAQAKIDKLINDGKMDAVQKSDGSYIGQKIGEQIGIYNKINRDAMGHQDTPADIAYRKQLAYKQAVTNANQVGTYAGGSPVTPKMERVPFSNPEQIIQRAPVLTPNGTQVVDTRDIMDKLREVSRNRNFSTYA